MVVWKREGNQVLATWNHSGGALAKLRSRLFFFFLSLNKENRFTNYTEKNLVVMEVGINTDQDLSLSWKCLLFGCLLYIYLLCAYMCTYGGQNTILWSRFSVFTFYVQSRDQTQVIILDYKYLYPVSHLATHKTFT